MTLLNRLSRNKWLIKLSQITPISKYIDFWVGDLKVTQLQIDNFRAAQLLLLYSKHDGSSNWKLSVSDKENFEKIVKGLVFDEELEKFVSKELNSQTVKIFSEIKRLDDLVNSKKFIHSESQWPSVTGFELEVKPSTVEGAGDGVFVKNGFVKPGSVVAYFPGAVHLKEFVGQQGYFEKLLPDPNYMLHGRHDGIVIDARVIPDVYNPFAVAHKINHVPEGSTPNTLQLPFNFNGDPFISSTFSFGITPFPEQLRQYIPNVYAKPPTLLGTIDRSVHMQTIVLLATQSIQAGDELFMDYRLIPEKMDIPAWYTPYDRDTTARILQEKFPQ